MPIPSGAPADTSLCAARWVKTAPASHGGGWKLQQWSVANSQWVDCAAYQADGTIVAPPPLLA
jgi:hypothetical protein